MFKKGLDTQSYKGVRDFYPEEMFLEKWLFSKMRETAESFGYLEYGASILEPAELYRAKTGEEIVNEQTYTFKDRGDREVTLRPEMTPTLARMVAAKKRDLSFPLRWYSLPNLFRYEKTQRGRLREHFQLNVDIFGGNELEADLEILTLAHKLLENLGATSNDFEIIINNRKIVEKLFEKFGLNGDQKQKLSKVIDKRSKISRDDFLVAIEILLKEKTQDFLKVLDSNKELVRTLGEESPEIKSLTNLIDALYIAGVKNVNFNPSLMRGFDYYTGMIFEIFDTNPENRRSLFGGGRFDELLEIFGEEEVPAAGFGAGDVTLIDFLETHNLLPEYKNSTQIYLCRVNKEVSNEVNDLAQFLREQKINVAVDITDRKLPDQIKIASKQKIPFVLCLGEDEVKTGQFKLKRLADGQEFSFKKEELTKILES